MCSKVAFKFLLLFQLSYNTEKFHMRDKSQNRMISLLSFVFACIRSLTTEHSNLLQTTIITCLSMQENHFGMQKINVHQTILYHPYIYILSHILSLQFTILRFALCLFRDVNKDVCNICIVPSVYFYYKVLKKNNKNHFY